MPYMVTVGPTARRCIRPLLGVLAAMGPSKRVLQTLSFSHSYGPKAGHATNQRGGSCTNPQPGAGCSEKHSQPQAGTWENCFCFLE